MKNLLRLLVVPVFLVLVSAAWGGVTVWEMPNPPVYEWEWGPAKVSANSPVELRIANVYDPARWKEWAFKVWVPIQDPDLLWVTVDYEVPNQPIIYVDVPLKPLTTPPPEPGFKGFYADTRLPDWEQFGTNPVGSGLPYDIGNPAWLSFHFDVPQDHDPYVYWWDKCVPEPATLVLLGLGALGLLRKRPA